VLGTVPEVKLKIKSPRAKGVHVKLDRQTHINFRTKLLYHGVTMQEAFEYFARLVGSGSAAANALLDRLVIENVKEELNGTGLRAPSRHSIRHRVEDLDPERVYDLINDADENDESKSHIRRK